MNRKENLREREETVSNEKRNRGFFVNLSCKFSVNTITVSETSTTFYNRIQLTIKY